MKAIVRTSLEAGSMSVQELPIPSIAEDEVLIRIEAVGVCGTDAHIYGGHVATKVPVVVGHELSGVVENIGNKVTGVKVGDRVVSRLNVEVCGVCRACLTGNPQMCEHRTCPGHIVDGAFADYMKIDAKQLIKIEDSISFEEAAMVEPMACVAHALVERTKVEPEDIVVLFGPGPIGLLALQMAKINGASKVVVVGTNSDENLRLPLAKKLGADYILNSQKDNVEDFISGLTNGQGADLCIECSGAAPAINTGIRSLRRQGRMCVIGLPGRKEIGIEWLTAAQKSLELVFSYSSSPLSWNMCLSMLGRKAIDVKSLISHTASLEDFKTIFDETAKGNVIKAIIKP
ncbi:zinc-dependent alcohol dehydrogenase [Clostridium magnum]|uniref:D-arabitol-phosphate dehydrogenase n=1 Tax=Clostridium magnum DSM 2767 TaxID=1121326 RepID=A0A162R0I5_9CLOT|nr:zinc-binding dehydrogenase [Clostridium magnum]KZL89239.1 D-arabitol-phosphate dehydrogenase [Clostridium magnum DSM 2767]SHJ55730.1 L-iditol 2-dehydrogenase [Clostridium magnum DSM 2767]